MPDLAEALDAACSAYAAAQAGGDPERLAEAGEALASACAAAAGSAGPSWAAEAAEAALAVHEAHAAAREAGGDPERAARAARELGDAAAALARHCRPPLDAEEVRTMPPDRRWIIRDWLPAGRAGILTGTGGTGKSRLALQLCAALAGSVRLAAASKWIDGDRDLPIEEGYRERTAVIASWEDEHEEQARRLLDWPAAREGEALDYWPDERERRLARLNALLGDRLRTVSMAGRGPIWGPDVAVHRGTRALLLPAGEQLLRYAAQASAALLVLDPAAAAFGGNENDRAAVREFMSHVDSWGRLNDCAILVIAHPAKEAGSSYSGSTDWQGAARTMWTFGAEPVGPAPRRGEADDRERAPTLRAIKANYARPPAAVRMDPESWTWWTASSAASGGLV